MDKTRFDAAGECVSFDETYFDGRTNARRSVSLRLKDALQIFESDSFVGAWALADIRRVDGPAGVLRIRSVAAPVGARCEIRNAQFAANVLQSCRLIDGDAQDEHTAVRNIVVWSLAAAASLGALVWWGVPLLADRLTPFVPYSIERRIGDVADAQARAMFKGDACASKAGQAALDKLVSALTISSSIRGSVRVAALSSKTVNAFALPGGRVYVLKGLIDAAQSPDEIAGVLSHEFGHVAHRDGLRVMIEQGSAAFVIGIFFGDVFGAGAMAAAARASLGAAYSRDAETQADEFAIATMTRAGRPAQPLGDLLARISKNETSTRWLDKHIKAAFG